MRLFGFGRREEKAAISLDTLIRRLEAMHETSSGIQVTPSTCMESPTVHAVVTGISRRIASLPVHVLQRTQSNGRVRKERAPSHPVTRLLEKPNEWQSRVDYFQDAASTLIRWGRFHAFKGRGQTGPIRTLFPLDPSQVELKQDESWNVRYAVTMPGGRFQEFAFPQIHTVRGPSQDFLNGDSPVMNCREAIALEIAAEKFGASFFGNGAMPGIIFQFMAGFAGFRTDEERKKFVEDFQAVYAKKGRFRSLLVPKGIEVGEQIPVENDKAQFLETRKLQRSIISGLLGVPPHIAGDLERATFSNIEHQSLEMVQTVVLPIVRQFEAAMERDLLTDEDRRSGVIIRFNIDGLLRGDFKSRQEGLNIMRTAGVISANDWREAENMNPISDEDGGEEYWRGGPSGQTAGEPQGEGDADETVS